MSRWSPDARATDAAPRPMRGMCRASATRMRGCRRGDLQQRRCPAGTTHVASPGPRRGQLAAHRRRQRVRGRLRARVVRNAVPTASTIVIGAKRRVCRRGQRRYRRGTDATAIMVLNADVRLAPGLRRRVTSRARTPGTGIAVPHLSDGQGALIPSMRREPTLTREVLETFLPRRLFHWSWDVGVMVMNPEAYTTETTTDWAEGSTQLISRECLDVCGPWDESFFLFSEETEFGLRARDLGYATRYVPTAGGHPSRGWICPGSSQMGTVVPEQDRVVPPPERSGAVARLPRRAPILREGNRAAMGRATSRAALRVLVSPRRLRAPAGPEWLRDATASESPAPLRQRPSLRSARVHEGASLPSSPQPGSTRRCRSRAR